MKRILLSLLTVGLVTSVGVFATRAFFSDVETSRDNTFTAGNLDLKVDYASTYNNQPSTNWSLTDLTNEKFFNFGDVKPGDSGEGTISLHIYDNNAWGCVTISPTANDDVSTAAPELAAGDTTDNPNNLWDGELAQNMQFRIWADTCAENARPGDNVYQADCDTLLTEGTGPVAPVTWALADSQHPNVFTHSGALVGGNTYYIGASWNIPNTVGNIIQTDKYQADISFYTEQERNNPNFACGTREIPTATPAP